MMLGGRLFGVQGSTFRVKGSGLVRALEVAGEGNEIEVLGLKVQGLWFRVWGFQVLAFGLRV